jgi:molecular chaperone Hsp33
MSSSADPAADAARDSARRFLFENADIRGEIVHLEASYRAVTDVHQYAPGVNRLLGEFQAAAVLLTSTLKFDGKLILQARSEGQIPLLMVECTSDRELRAIARGAGEATSERFDELLARGQLAITIDPRRGQRYQGIVPLLPDSLAASLEGYFAQSEQLQTRLWLACDGRRAAGMLLQQLPPQLAEDPEQRRLNWEHAGALAATVQAEELLNLPVRGLLHRLYHSEPVRLFDPAPVRFLCNCSRERTLNALLAMDHAEVDELLSELGSITMDCEFCNARYQFYREDLAPSGDGIEQNTVH